MIDNPQMLLNSWKFKAPTVIADLGMQKTSRGRGRARAK